MKTTAIIVAAGSGSRFKSDTPKQFLELAGRPVIFHSLEKFQAARSIDEIVLVLSQKEIERFEWPSGFSKLLKAVAGGESRAESVRNGLASIGGQETRIVAVHDGARPLVTVDEIERVIERAKQTGAACLVAPVTDTIKTIHGDEISGTVDREKLRRALTPQVFKIEVLRRAFDGIELSDEITDECYLVEKLGHPIAFVDGSSRNIKITTPEDLAIARNILSDLET